MPAEVSGSAGSTEAAQARGRADVGHDNEIRVLTDGLEAALECQLPSESGKRGVNYVEARPRAHLDASPPQCLGAPSSLGGHRAGGASRRQFAPKENIGGVREHLDRSSVGTSSLAEELEARLPGDCEGSHADPGPVEKGTRETTRVRGGRKDLHPAPAQFHLAGPGWAVKPGSGGRIDGDDSHWGAKRNEEHPKLTR